MHVFLVIYDNYENSYKCLPAKKNTASIAGRLERGNNDASMRAGSQAEMRACTDGI
jgi:hypothetical protein